jgi:hypothetical protein
MSYAPILSVPGSCRKELLETAVNSSGARKMASLCDSHQSHPVVVHSHLCWDWVWQRPQQFISRLSRRRRVLFVETHAPSPDLGAPLVRFRNVESLPNLTSFKGAPPGD